MTGRVVYYRHPNLGPEARYRRRTTAAEGAVSKMRDRLVPIPAAATDRGDVLARLPLH